MRSPLQRSDGVDATASSPTPKGDEEIPILLFYVLENLSAVIFCISLYSVGNECSKLETFITAETVFIWSSFCVQSPLQKL